MSKTFWAFLMAAILPVVAVAAIESPAIVVSGTCLRSVTPDQVAVGVGVVIRKPDAQTASAAAAPKYERLLRAVKDLNLKNAEFETTDLRVGQVFEYRKDREISKGFEANYSFTITTSDLTRVSEVFRVAKEGGATRVQGPVFGLSKNLRKKEYETCLEDAVQNARSKAQTMAKSLGVELTGKALIRESAEGIAYLKSEMAGGAMKDSIAPTVESKKEDVQVKLEATFFMR